MIKDLLFILLAICFTSALRLHAQGLGSISGQVIDAKGGTPIGYANILIDNAGGGAVSDEDGKFLIENLQDGIYSLTISYLSYNPFSIKDLSITNGAPINLDPILMEASALTLSEVTVSPGSYSIMEKIRSSSQLVLSEQNLEYMALGGDVTRAVSRLPGISASDYSSKFAIRGGEANQVLISLDGMELYEPFHQRDVSGGLFSIIDVEVLRGIDLLTGGFSAENGNRLSGVFGMKTKTQVANERNISVGLSVMNARLYADGKFANNKGSYLFSARRGMLDISLKALGNEEFFPKFYDGLSKIEYQLNDKHFISLHMLHAGDRSFINNSPEGDALDQFNSKFSNTYGWLTLKSYYSKNLFSRTMLYSGNLKKDRTGASDKYEPSDKGSFSVSDQRNFNSLGIKQDWNWEGSDRIHFKFGVDIKKLEATYDYVNALHEIRVNANEELFNFDRDLDIKMKPAGEQIGTYLTSRFKILPKLIAEAGARFDYTSYSNDRNWSPRASIAYAFGKSTFLRAGWGHYFQSQFIDNIDVNNGNTTFNSAELAKHYVLGFEHLLKNGISLRAEAYFKDLSNVSPLWQNLRDHLENYPEARNDNARVTFDGITSKGLEFFVRYDLDKKISWWLSYALAAATDDVKDVEYDGLLIKQTGKLPRLNDQRHTIYADINYRPNKTWRFNASWQFYRGWPRTDYTYRYQVLPNDDLHFYAVHLKFNGTLYPAYHRLDIRADKTFKTKKGELTAFLHMVNLYNRKNLKKFDLDTENDLGEFSLDAQGNYVPFEDSKYWLGLLPVFGIKWEMSY